MGRLERADAQNPFQAICVRCGRPRLAMGQVLPDELLHPGFVPTDFALFHRTVGAGLFGLLLDDITTGYGVKKPLGNRIDLIRNMEQA